jgi:hypothetical protein
MSGNALPATLAGFIQERLPLFNGETPDDGWIEDVAEMYRTTTAAVRQAIGSLSVAPVAPRVSDRMQETSRPRGFEAVISRFRQHGHTLQPNRKGSVTRCPLHPDHRPSLQISRGHDGITALVYCHSCGKSKTKLILAAVGLTMADLFPTDQVIRARAPIEVLATYPYVTLDGKPIATKVRYRDNFSNKRFGWRVGDRWKLTEAAREALGLYREPDLIDSSTIYVVEGEKAADRLWEEGLPATCGPHGAGSWDPRWSRSLSVVGARHAVILTDHDAAGRAHGELVAAAIAGLAEERIAVKVVALPDLKAGQDVCDWLAAGHTIEDLENVVAATPGWTPELLEQQRIEQQRKRWREKKRRQRQARRLRSGTVPVPVRMSDETGVPLRMSEPEPSSPPRPLSPRPPCERISVIPSKV